MPGADTTAVAVIVYEGRVLVVRPPDPGQGECWRFPAAMVGHGETVAEAAVREASHTAQMDFVARGVLGGQVHPLTGHRMLFVACELPGEAPPAARAEVAWSTSGELSCYVHDGSCPSLRLYLDEVLRD